MSVKSVPNLSFEHPYPPTKLMFNLSFLPPAISSDDGRLTKIQITSFDWNDVEPKRPGTCSIDTTCTIWDVEKCLVETQKFMILVGEKLGFSLRFLLMDRSLVGLRDKEHSTIIYESPQPGTPLLRRFESLKGIRPGGDDIYSGSYLGAGPNGIDPMSVYSVAVVFRAA